MKLLTVSANLRGPNPTPKIGGLILVMIRMERCDDGTPPAFNMIVGPAESPSSFISWKIIFWNQHPKQSFVMKFISNNLVTNEFSKPHL